MHKYAKIPVLHCIRLQNHSLDFCNLFRKKSFVSLFNITLEFTFFFSVKSIGSISIFGVKQSPLKEDLSLFVVDFIIGFVDSIVKIKILSYSILLYRYTMFHFKFHFSIYCCDYRHCI